jgi:hypothetical protein
MGAFSSFQRRVGVRVLVAVIAGGLVRAGQVDATAQILNFLEDLAFLKECV